MKLKLISDIRTKRRIDGTAIHQVTGINRDSHLCFLTCQKKIHELNKDKFVTVTDIKSPSAKNEIHLEMTPNSKWRVMMMSQQPRDTWQLWLWLCRLPTLESQSIVTVVKKNDLLWMCEELIIPRDYHPFYRILQFVLHTHRLLSQRQHYWAESHWNKETSRRCRYQYW